MALVLVATMPRKGASKRTRPRRPRSRARTSKRSMAGAEAHMPQTEAMRVTRLTLKAEQLAPDDAGMMGDLGDPTAGRVRGCYYANNGADARLTNEDPSKLSVVVTMLKQAQGLAGIGLEKGEEGVEGEADIEEPVSSRPNCTGKAYLSVDGSPGRLAYREQARLLSVGDHSLANVSVHCGSLHVENKV